MLRCSHLTGFNKRFPIPGGGVSPLAWYKGENNTNDETGSYNGTAGAGLVYDTGNSGNAFKFVGTTDSVLSIPAIVLGNNHTFDFWLFVSDLAPSFQDVIGYNFNGSTAEFGTIYVNSSKLEYWHTGSKRVQGVTTLTVSTWYHVKLTYSSSDSKARFYIGGSLDATESGTHTENITTGTTIGFGKSTFATSNNLRGRLDDVKIYNAVV